MLHMALNIVAALTVNISQIDYYGSGQKLRTTRLSKLLCSISSLQLIAAHYRYMPDVHTDGKNAPGL